MGRDEAWLRQALVGALPGWEPEVVADVASSIARGSAEEADAVVQVSFMFFHRVMLGLCFGLVGPHG
jgi:hypothetical protein